MQTSVWRLIPPMRASGKIQMAIDCWLLEQHAAGKLPPVLRFYTWDPVTISLGYHQRRWPQRWELLSWQGTPVELVRRPTGGRSVLHHGDLTYMVVTSDLSGNGGGSIAKRSPLPEYETICQFLIEGWRSLGVELHYGCAGRGYTQTANCFATATVADLVLPTGTKFIGSAQLRKGGAILQHGSIQLDPCSEFFVEVFGTEAAVSVEDIEGLPQCLRSDRSVEISTIIESLLAAACQCFGATMVMQPLSPAEWQEILPLSSDFSEIHHSLTS